MNPATPTTVFKPAGLRETTVLLAIAWLVPFALHLAPWTGTRPLGAYLVPMFWTAFVAVYFYGMGTGLLVGLFAPVVNLLVTGLPAGKYLIPMGIELAVFSLVTAWAMRRMWRLVLIAPLGYVVAGAVSIALRVVWPALGSVGAAGPVAQFGRSLVGGLAGLVVLASINAALVWFYPKAKTDDVQ